jgi:periplasmic protein TonB
VQLQLSPISATPAQSTDEPQADAPTPEPSLAATPPNPDPPPSQAAHDPNPNPAPPDVSAPAPASEPTPTPAQPTPATVALPPEPPSASTTAPSAAASAEPPVAPSVSPGREEETVSPAAVRTWQRELIAQIERHKHFPANGKGRSGVVTIAFRIDRDGALTQVRVVASSGSTALDQAAVDLIRQSQPFPRPPATLAENDLSFAAPIRYLPSGAH